MFPARRVRQRTYALRCLCLTLVLAFPSFCGAQNDESAETAKTIRVWGIGQDDGGSMQRLLEAWEQGFQTSHSQQRFARFLFGGESALGGLYTGVADIAILDREASFIEADAYHQASGFAPFGVPVGHGSAATPGVSPALALCVHAENPLTQLTLQQIDGIFDVVPFASKRRLRTWGDLGLTGLWAAQPIHLYRPAAVSPEMRLLEHAALKGSQKLACCDGRFSGKTARDQINAALARDKYGLALTTLPTPGLKVLLVASEGEGKAVAPTAQTIADGSYPLAHTIYVYLRRQPGSPAPAAVGEFLRYIVSSAGQSVITEKGGGYLPLAPKEAEDAARALQ